MGASNAEQKNKKGPLIRKKKKPRKPVLGTHEKKKGGQKPNRPTGKKGKTTRGEGP